MTDRGEPVLDVHDVRKRYARRGPWVLDRVDLALAPGTVTLVHGGNGSGKSTLLRIAAGVLDPTAGTVARAHGPRAYVPERAPTQIRTTAAVYTAHMGRIRGLEPHRCATRAAELFARFALEPGPDVPVAELSKGNRQKVLLTQALLEPVALLALDEPFAGLDHAAHVTLVDLLAEARAGGAAILVTGHSAGSLPGADRVLRVAGGALSADAPPSPDAPDVPVAPRSAVSVELARGDSSSVVSVVTEPAASDALLRRALASGWSVVRVERIERP